MPLPLAIPLIGSAIASIAIPFFFPTKAEQEREEIKDKVLSEIKINGFTNTNGTFTLNKKIETPQKVKDFSNILIIFAMLFVVMLVLK